MWCRWSCFSASVSRAPAASHSLMRTSPATATRACRSRAETSSVLSAAKASRADFWPGSQTAALRDTSDSRCSRAPGPRSARWDKPSVGEPAIHERAVARAAAVSSWRASSVLTWVERDQALSTTAFRVAAPVADPGGAEFAKHGQAKKAPAMHIDRRQARMCSPSGDRNNHRGCAQRHGRSRAQSVSITCAIVPRQLSRGMEQGDGADRPDRVRG